VSTQSVLQNISHIYCTQIVHADSPLKILVICSTMFVLHLSFNNFYGAVICIFALLKYVLHESPSLHVMTNLNDIRVSLHCRTAFCEQARLMKQHLNCVKVHPVPSKHFRGPCAQEIRGPKTIV
jgi:hypothetical protein